MKQNDLDRMLANEEEITPSSNFTASVMQAVEREAAASRPLEFPWLRALPGFVAALVALAAAIRNGIGLLNDPAAMADFGSVLLQCERYAASIGLHWILLAAAITTVSVVLPSRLMDRN